MKRRTSKFTANHPSGILWLTIHNDCPGGARHAGFFCRFRIGIRILASKSGQADIRVKIAHRLDTTSNTLIIELIKVDLYYENSSILISRS